jgi:DNA (cytosine-5)-methyltransferase 1
VSRPRILDLCCGTGLVADGLRAAGWYTTGVDLEPQPRYPGPFIQADATRLDQRFLRSFDAIWASPPCLRDTAMRHAPGAKGESHPELIPTIRKLLAASGLPYVIENVEGAALLNPVILSGSMFALSIEVDGRRYYLNRRRKFETNWPLSAPHKPEVRRPVVGVYGGHARVRAASAGGRGTADFVGHKHRQIMGRAMGVPDDRPVTCDELSQGIPPKYAEYVGGELQAHLQARRSAA